MNWKAIVLTVFTIVSAYQMVLHFIQYRSAENPTPDNVKDVYDQETYQKWKKYSAEKCRLQIFSTLIAWAVTMLMLIFNEHAAFASLFPQGVSWQLISVLVLEALVSTAFGAITGFVDQMVIEQKYGFNRSTIKTFVLDQVRAFVIEALLSILIVSILAALHGSLGDWMILLFAAVVSCIMLAISFLYPILSRWGNKFVPLEEGELKERLSGLLTSHGYHVKAIEVMDASRRTTKSNAYFTGFGRMKTIVLYDNLVNTMTPDEICAVFAHELGHGLHKDVLKQQLMNVGNMLIMALMAWLTVHDAGVHQAFGFETVNYGFAYILLGTTLLSLVQPLTGILTNAYSRHAEYRADHQAVLEGYGDALVSGLKKLARENFSHLAPSSLLVVLEYSHPPLHKRIETVQKK